MVRFIAADDDRSPRQIVARCTALKLGLYAAVALVAAAAAPFYLARLGIPASYGALYPVAVAAGAMLAATNFAMAFFQGLQRYGMFAVQAVIVNCVRALVMGAALVAGWRSLELLAGAFFAAPLAGAISGVYLIVRTLRRTPARPPAEAAWGALIRFAAPIALMQFVIIANMRLNSFLLKALASPSALAAYELAYQVGFALPLLTHAFFTVLLPRVSAMKAPAELAAYRRKALRLYPLVAVVTAAAVFLIPYPLRWVFDQKYAEAIPVLRVLLVTFGIHVVSHPLSLIFYNANRPHYLTALYTLQLVLLTPASLILIPSFGAVGAASALLAVTCVSVTGVILLSGRTVRDLETLR
jgi:O-antigen/teichoic acid export membrane protein